MQIRNSENDGARENQNTGIVVQERTKTPAMYAVVVHNDSFTPRDFVVEVLRRFFNKTLEQAAQIMLTAHTTGNSVVSIYTLEMAETKAAQANIYSHEQGKILIFSVEEA